MYEKHRQTAGFFSFITLAIFSSLLLSSSISTVMILFTSQQKAIAVPTITNFVQYQNPALGFIIQRPSDWAIEESNNGVKFYLPSSGLFRDYVGIVVVPSQGMTLDQITTQTINEGRNTLPNFQLLGNVHDPATNSSAETVWLHYTFKTKDNISGQQLIIVEVNEGLTLSTKGDKVYDFSFVAEPFKYQSNNMIVQQMFKSYRFS